MMAAIDVAKSLMLARDDLNTVLLVSGFAIRTSSIFPIRDSIHDGIGSAGSACFLRKNLGRNVVLASAFKGDGSLSEMCVVPVLGSKAWPPS